MAGQQQQEQATKSLSLWDILNSQLMLWFLGSVVLSGITFYWNKRNDSRAEASKEQQQKIDRQREDSQFLGTMLPYLTSSDPNVRLRAVDVITARYPDQQVPEQVYRLIAKVIGTEAGADQAHQSEETKTLIANAARTLDRQAPADTDVSAVVRQLPARVYMQIFEEGQRSKSKGIQELLRKDGLLVPGIENVGGKTKAFKGTLVKFFNASDAAMAERVREILIHNGFPQAQIQETAMKVNPGTIEVWFGDGT